MRVRPTVHPSHTTVVLEVGQVCIFVNEVDVYGMHCPPCLGQVGEEAVWLMWCNMTATI